MADVEARCEGCGNYIDLEDLFCGNCGREAPGGGVSGPVRIEEGFIGFDCETCGASMTYDAVEGGLRCAFCGSVRMKRQPQATGRIEARWYLPFEVGREAAVSAFERWIAKGFFRPFGIKTEARVVSMVPVFLPFWMFRARTHTYFTGDTSRTPPLARADWCPVFGEIEGEVDGVLVAASGSLQGGEVAAIEPFDFTRRREYRREDLKGHAVEDFGVSRRGARPRARTLMLERERAAAASRIPGKSRNVHVNTLFTEMRSEPVLLPVWINAYRFRDVTYRFIVNGQSGALAGRAPFSWAKLVLVILAALALAIIVAAVAA